MDLSISHPIMSKKQQSTFKQNLISWVNIIWLACNILWIMRKDFYKLTSKWEHLVYVLPSGPRGGQLQTQEDLTYLMFALAFIMYCITLKMRTSGSPQFVSEAGQTLAREHHLTGCSLRSRFFFWWFILYLYFKYKYIEIQKYKWFASIFIKNCSNCGTRASEYTAD